MTGGCLCGAVRYRIAGRTSDVVCCHCEQCRRTSGHYVAAARAGRDAIAITGPVTWFQSSSAVRRGFCPVCGSNLFWERPDSAYRWVHAGTLDAPTGLSTRRHVWVSEKADYYALADGLPQSPACDMDLVK